MSQQIEIIIDTKGNIRSNVSGFQGEACLQDAQVKLLERAMGIDTEISMKDTTCTETTVKEKE